MAHRLDPLLRPASVAVVGASSSAGNLGGNVVKNLLAAEFPGPVYPVHPRERAVHGLTVHAEAGSLPAGVDCAVIAIAAERVEGVVRACLERGVRSFVLLCNGFAETGTPEGRERQWRLHDLLGPSGPPACGPNCMGYVNPGGRSLCYSHWFPHLPQPGTIGLVAHSGSVSLGLLENGRRLPFSFAISCGNELNANAAEYIDFLVDDPETQVIACFLEEVRDGPGFVASLRRACQAGKPVVLLKAGRSAAGAHQVRSHTDALAGRAAVFDAVSRKHGAIVTHDLEEQLVVCDLLRRGRVPAGPRIGAVAGSGGELALVADLAEAEDLDAHVLLDIWGKGFVDQSQVEQEVRRLSARPDVDAVMVIHDLGIGNPRGTMYARAVAAVVPSTGSKPVFFCSNFVAGLDPDALAALHEGDVPMLPGVRQALRVLARLQPALPSGREAAAPPIPLNLPPRPLNEAEVKDLLRGLGITTPRGGVALDEEQAVHLAAEVGYPVALKLAWPSAVHKSDVGGVALGLDAEGAVRAAYRRLTSATSIPLDGVLVEEMICGGQEMIVSRFRDETFGPVLMVGCGGLLADLLADTCILIPPFGPDEARRTLLGLRSARLLQGFRGRPALDLDALVAALCTLGRLDAPQVGALEINPLLVRPAGTGVVALDARLESA